MEQKQSGFGIASLILGIIGMILSFVAIGILPCVLGLIFSIIGFTQKNKKHGTCIGGLVCSVIGIGIFSLIFLLISSTSEPTTSTTKKDNISTTVTTENNNTEIKELSGNDFETKEYIYENTIGDTLYFVVVKNNSDITVKISANATAYDTNANPIGADSSEMYALGSGQEEIMCFYFDSVSGVESVEYTLDYSEDNYYESVLQDLEIEENVNGENVIVSITNNGEESAQFVEAYALFLDENGNVIYYDSKYITDSDSEIKPQKTISEQLTSYQNFSDVVVYYNGRK